MALGFGFSTRLDPNLSLPQQTIYQSYRDGLSKRKEGQWRTIDLKVKVVFKSDREIDLPVKEVDGKEYYILKHDDVEYEGREARYDFTATFHIPFKGVLLGLPFESTATLQFTAKKQQVIVTFERVDLYQIYRLLVSNSGAQWKLKSVWLDNGLRKAWTQWPWNIDFLLMEFRHNPEKTLSFVRPHLPELVTVMSLRKIPREFDEPTALISFDDASSELDW